MNEIEYLRKVKIDIEVYLKLSGPQEPLIFQVVSNIEGRITALDLEASEEITNEQLRRHIHSVVKHEIKNQKETNK